MSFRFLHLADLHLETCFGGKPGTRERLREATLESFDRAVDYAISERLHAVLAAGGGNITDIIPVNPGTDFTAQILDVFLENGTKLLYLPIARCCSRRHKRSV